MSISQSVEHSPEPRIDIIRHELKRRLLTVTSTGWITPKMRRISFCGEDLADFTSISPDDHVKLFLPGKDGEEECRDYTPRRYDASAQMLTIDFAVHEAGPATQWASEAQVGDTILIGGPRGSKVISGNIQHWLLIGDETALPAIGRRVEETPQGVNVTTLSAVSGPKEEQTFATNASLKSLWVHRPLSQGNDAAQILSALASLEIKPETFIWIAAEAMVVRTLRSYMRDQRGHASAWMKVAGYWKLGEADSHENFE